MLLAKWNQSCLNGLNIADKVYFRESQNCEKLTNRRTDELQVVEERWQTIRKLIIISLTVYFSIIGY